MKKLLYLPCKGRWVQLVALERIGKMARTSSPCHFWRFPSFAQGQYPRTAPARKIRNLSHFLKVLQNKKRWRFQLSPTLNFFCICILFCDSTFLLFNAFINKYKHNYTHYYTTDIGCCLRPNYAFKSDKFIHNKEHRNIDKSLPAE